MRTRAATLALLCGLIALASPARADGLWGNGSGPCSAFGSTAGTCAQGSDARFPPGNWPTTTINGDLITFNGTSGAPQDSGVLLSSLAPLASPTFTGTVTFPGGGTATTAGFNSLAALGVGTSAGSAGTITATGSVTLTGTYAGLTMQGAGALISFANGNAILGYSYTQHILQIGAASSSPYLGGLVLGSSGSGTNIAAGNGEIDLPVGTGTGALPTFTLKAPTALQGSGSTAQTLSTVFKEALGDIEIGAGSAIATNSTSGFFALETMNGAPSGTPTNAAAGLAQCVINYASQNLNCYINGGWYHTAFTSGAN